MKRVNKPNGEEAANFVTTDRTGVAELENTDNADLTKRDILVTGDSVIRGTDTYICREDDGHQIVLCLRGVKVQDVMKALECFNGGQAHTLCYLNIPTLRLHNSKENGKYTIPRSPSIVAGFLVRTLDFIQPPDNITVCQGDNATLSCLIDSEVTRVAWLNRSNILYAGKDKWSIDQRVHLLTNSKSEYSIMIRQVDVYDEGLYVCSYQTQDRPHTAQVYLIVQVPAKIVNISSNLSVNEGNNVNVLCVAIGRPEPTVSWRHIKGGYTNEGEYLEITDINRQQAGEYECIAANGVMSSDSKKVQITVNYPPTITDATNAHVALGKTALLRCDALAVPTAEFDWYKEDRRMSSDFGLRIQNEKTRSVLVFSNVTQRHYGNYTCVASNKLGTVNVSMLLLRPGSLQNGSITGIETPFLLWLLSLTFITLLFKI
ncbi:igLON family member 5 [Protopterus annectens]|uniref:igLON family member 5 n=1 Tax=Protopterus annectens TaxID=7888 RepID=UPI001CFB2DFA|nr:igLON family member 5 [Protopterus annectens]